LEFHLFYRIASMHIHQFQVSYVAEHDRILVRMNSKAGQEQRLWLTRRMLRGLYPHLEKVSAQMAIPNAAPAGHDGAAQAAVDAYQRQETLHNVDFDTPFQSSNALQDAADAPLLVTTAHIQIQGKESLVIRFEETLAGAEDTRQMEIQMQADTLIALLHVIGLAMQGSDWGLGPAANINSPAPAVPAADTDATASGWDAFDAIDPPKYLN
jgi:hypothetical protein